MDGGGGCIGVIAFGTRAHVYVREGVYTRAFVRPCVRVCMDGYVGVDMGVVTRAMHGR